MLKTVEGAKNSAHVHRGNGSKSENRVKNFRMVEPTKETNKKAAPSSFRVR